MISSSKVLMALIPTLDTLQKGVVFFFGTGAALPRTEKLFSQSTGDFSAFLANLSFLLLFLAMSLYWISLAFYKTKKVGYINQHNYVAKTLEKMPSTLNATRSLVRSPEQNISLANFGRLAIYGSNVSLFLLLCVRWQESGHFPLSNLYESLMFLSWSCTSIHIFLINSQALPRLKSNTALGSLSSGWDGQSAALPRQGKALPEYVFTNLLLGSVLAPSALFLNAFATFSLPKEMQQAGPLVPALQSNWLMMHVTVMIISYSALMLGSLLAIAYLIFTKVSAPEGPSASRNTGKVDKTLANQTLDMIFGAPPSQNNPTGAVVASTYLERGTTLTLEDRTLNQNRGDKPKLIASVEVRSLIDNLDYLSYRIIGIGFPFLTIGILSGAVWANEAWGSYWSWDPKETWALLTWFVFAIYLHTRLQKGWQGEKPAMLASLGFIVVWICYLGVNLLGEGLHSYGFLT